MNKIQVVSGRTVRKTLAVLAWVGFFSISAGFGFCLELGPSDDTWLQFFNFWGYSSYSLMVHAALINAAISIGIALLAWSSFRLVQPAHPNRNWQIAEVILVPLFWLLLLVAADVSLCWFVERSIQDFQDSFQRFQTLRS